MQKVGGKGEGTGIEAMLEGIGIATRGSGLVMGFGSGEGWFAPRGGLPCGYDVAKAASASGGS
jgi:hypothetical protein